MKGEVLKGLIHGFPVMRLLLGTRANLGRGLEHYKTKYLLHKSHIVAGGIGETAPGIVFPYPAQHLEIISEINHRFLQEVEQRYPGETDRKLRLSIVEENEGRHIRMAHLACIASHRINGVAKLHTELLKSSVLREFHEMYPERFTSITNGVTLRRFVALSNPRLTHLLNEAIGDSWIYDPEEELPKLEGLANDGAFQDEWRKIKRENKADLADIIRRQAQFVHHSRTTVGKGGGETIK